MNCIEKSISSFTGQFSSRNFGSRTIKSSTGMISKRQMISKLFNHLKALGKGIKIETKETVPEFAKTLAPSIESPNIWKRDKSPISLHEKFRKEEEIRKSLIRENAHLSELEKRKLESNLLKAEHDELTQRISKIDDVTRKTSNDYKELEEDLAKVRDFVEIKSKPFS